MGNCCRSKNSLPATSQTQTVVNVVKFEEEDICQTTVSEKKSTDGDDRTLVQRLVLEVLEIVRKLTERFVYQQRK